MSPEPREHIGNIVKRDPMGEKGQEVPAGSFQTASSVEQYVGLLYVVIYKYLLFHIKKHNDGAGCRNRTRDLLITNRSFRRRDARARPSFDLQKQRDKFALAMCVGLGKDRFQLIARRLP